jgi:hypothetical protein
VLATKSVPELELAQLPPQPRLGIRHISPEPPDDHRP